MKHNKKAFTIVELVIVIAVIAVLAAVLIPTFSGIFEKARKSAALQEARSTFSTYYYDNNVIDPIPREDAYDNFAIEADGYWFVVYEGAFDTTPKTEAEARQIFTAGGYTLSTTPIEGDYACDIYHADK